MILRRNSFLSVFLYIRKISGEWGSTDQAFIESKFQLHFLMFAYSESILKNILIKKIWLIIFK